MHIPGHVLDLETCVATGIISVAAVGYAQWRVQTDRQSRPLWLVLMTGACIFAAQMLNFPIASGTSGHLLGGILAAIILGPWLGILSVTAVLAIQCLLFHDGGIDALGANVLNMAVVGAGVGYEIFALISRHFAGFRGRLLGAAIAGWSSVVLAAALCSIELSIGLHFPFGRTLAAMFPAHSLIGLVEATITAAACAAILSERSDVLNYAKRSQTADHRGFLARAGVSSALLVAIILIPFASSQPDALQRSLQKLSGEATQISTVAEKPPAA